jgi:hypothetical protein
MLAGLLLAVVSASGSSTNPATCSLTLTGSRSGNTSTISVASIQCSGGIVSASADETLLGSFTKSDKIGVNMTDRECTHEPLRAASCVLEAAVQFVADSLRV